VTGIDASKDVATHKHGANAIEPKVTARHAEHEYNLALAALTHATRNIGVATFVLR
jgi:hypothetical protein